MQQRPPKIAVPRNVNGSASASLPSTPQPLSSPAVGVPSGPGSRGNLKQSQQIVQQYMPQNSIQQNIPPTQTTPKGKDRFNHRRIQSFLQASGFRKSNSGLESSGETPRGPVEVKHKRENSLWSPDIWHNILQAGMPGSANGSSKSNPAVEDSVPTPHHQYNMVSPDVLPQHNYRGHPMHNVQPPPAYGSTGKLLHHLEPSPRMQKAAQEYFKMEGPSVVNNPEQTQPQVQMGSRNIPHNQMSGHPPRVSRPTDPNTINLPPKRAMSATRIIEFQKASGVRAIGARDQLGEMDPNFLTRYEKPDPQTKTPLPSALVIRLIVVVNICVSVAYVYWRIGNTITNIDSYFFGISFLPVVIWGWTFFAVELCLIIAIWIGHTQRLFACQRIKLTMDDIVREDDSVGYNSRIAILLPTNGESLDVVMKALLGCLSQRGWETSIERCASQRIIMLDEKRRKGVLNMAAAVYALATVVRHPNVLSILQAEGVQAITAKGFYEWWKIGGGYARKHLYNDHFLNQACRLLEYMQEESSAEEIVQATFGLEELPPEVKGKHEIARKSRVTTQASANSMLQAMNVGNVTIEPGYVQTFNTNVALPTVIYYTRRDAGTPKVSPKAGNMNAALFALDYPDMPPLIGNSTIVVVNDCRHQLQSEFLQRTVPYFFELDKGGQRYRWAKVAFVQTPQRFDTNLQANDPLGNHAAVQYDVINHGKDGIGAVSSSGQGSLWRVAALKGVDAFGNQYADCSHRGLVGHKLGFRSEMLIEDTHTSIDMFRHGWTSRYVNEKGEHLSMCTHQPNNIEWRIKQVLRWHQGAVQLLFFKGITFTCWGGKFPTVFHRIYAFDQATYYLQAIPGYMLLLMPIIYGIAGEPPFNTTVGEFFLFFTPFIVTAMLPTVISGSWRGVDAHRLTRDEQVWLSTTYVQIYAFLSMMWQQLRCKGGDNAWAVKAPVWPLFAVFIGEFAAIGGAMVWVSREGYSNWSANLISVLVSASLAIHALWPMVSLQLGWQIPSLYYMKLGAWLVVGVFIVLIYYIST